MGMEVCPSRTGPLVQNFSQNGGIGSPVNINIPTVSSAGLGVAITSSDPNDCVRNIRLVMPGLQNTYQSDPFNPQYISTIQPLSTIRFMAFTDYASATTTGGQSGELTWDERTTPTWTGTQAGVGGVSVEDLVQLCNTAHVNLWIGMPVNADAGYETNFAVREQIRSWTQGLCRIWS